MTFVGEDAFRKDLGSTPDQAAVLDALFKDPDFAKIWEYLKKCPAARITLRVKKGLKIGGVERFGGFSPDDNELTINPAKKEHVDNPEELADTIIHECIHAVLALRDKCGETGYPLLPGVTDAPHDPNLPHGRGGLDKSKFSGAEKEYLDKHYGDSPSAPRKEYIDENDKAQELIRKIIQRLIDKTGKGKPTTTFPKGKSP